VATAHELAANAVRQGAGYGRLRLHSDGQALLCRVSDDGPAPAAPAGNGQASAPGGGLPSWPAEHPHGLWIVEQAADQFTVDHGPAGTIATASFTISPDPEVP
jgi:anti-sigma regulatory factor (Ser/Thr protein kinase)